MIWWLAYPCAYFLLCVFIMKLFKWAGEHENFDSIESQDEYEWTEMSTETSANENRTAHRARGIYREDCQ